MIKALVTLGIGILIAVGVQAEGKKYIVTVKSSQVFGQLKAQQQGFNTFGAFSNGGNQFNFLSRGQGQVKKTFDNLDMVVIESNNPQQIAFLKANPDVEVEEEVIIPEPQPIGTFSSANAGLSVLNGAIDTPWGVKAVRAPEAWAGSDFGNGTRVLVLDTGIDRDHPALKNNFEQGKNFMARDDEPPYEYLDVNGHGTHVAGTIAADGLNGNIVGVAPKAKILSGRVCGGGCSSIAIIAGVDWGISQRVDVMNLSLGGAFPSQAARKAFERAETANIVVVAAAGNDGNNRVSYPAAYPTTVAVGAVAPDLSKADFSQWGPQLDIMAPGVDVNSSVPQGTGRAAHLELTNKNGISPLSTAAMSGSGVGSITGDVVFAGLGKPEDVKDLDLTGKVALIQRGEIAFKDKADNAIAKGAQAVVVFNNEPGLLHGTLGDGVDYVDKVVLGISMEDGQTILQELQASSDTIAMTAAVDKTDYSEFQGTSMASPHVAGVVALIRAAGPQLTPAQVRQLIKSTATQLSGDNAQNQLGSGLINAELAVTNAPLNSTEGGLLLTGTN